jgi:putative ABC transport system permease protein
MALPLYYNVRSLWARRLSTAASVLGLALVVFVFAAVLMLSHGIEASLQAGGSAQNAVLLREGATAEISSMVPREHISVIGTFADVALGPSGQPMIAGELVVLVALEREAGGFINISVRGVAPESYLIRETVRIVEGRRPRPGSYEVAIGSGLAGRTAGAFVGGELSFANARWQIVGRLDASGGAFDSEIWADRDRLASAYDRTEYSSAVMRLADPSGFSAFGARIEDDRRFELELQREDLYWADAASSTATFIRVLGLFVSVVFSGGAILGAMITMYAQVAARSREIGMIRALGFSRRSVLASMIIESLALGGAGGVIGAAAAAMMRLVQIRTMNFQTFAEVRFGFEPTPGILLAALAFGLSMGLLGGFLPAVRAARMPIIDATRA